MVGKTRRIKCKCTYHHHQQLQGHAEVFLMLFYSWGFCTNLRIHQASLAGCVCKLLHPLRQHRRKTGAQKRSWGSALHFEQRLRWMQDAERQSFCLVEHLSQVETFLHYFKTGFDIIKIRSHKDVLCNWNFLCICLFEKLSNIVGSDFLNVAYLGLLMPSLFPTLSNLLNSDSTKKRFHWLRAWIVWNLKVFNVVSFFLRFLKHCELLNMLSILCPTQICLCNSSFSSFVLPFEYIVLDMYSFIL